MASKRETVLAAVKALVAAALPGAEVKRNLAKAERIPPGGLVVIRDGDPGDPEVSLSPLTYLYSHRIPLEIAAYESATLTREQVLDAMLGATGAAVIANRTLKKKLEERPPDGTVRRPFCVAGMQSACAQASTSRRWRFFSKTLRTDASSCPRLSTMPPVATTL